MPHCPDCTAPVERVATHCTNCGGHFLAPRLGWLESRLSASQEAQAPVPAALPVVLGLAGIGGAAWGLLAVVMTVAQSRPGLFGALVMAVVAAVYGFGAYAGVLALRRTPGWIRANSLSWAVQVPVFSSPLLAYGLASGGFVSVWLRIHPSVEAGVNFLLGSRFTLSFLQSQPVLLGVNVLALAVVVVLHRVQRRALAPAAAPPAA